METTIVKKNNLDFPLNSNNSNNSHSHSPTFLFPDGFDSPEFKASDIEMITIQSLTYTSLKDLLPASPPAAIMSPTHNSSWHDEIPIRNPLVKHAALAYLQPMSTPTEVGDKGLFGKLKEKCLCGGGGGGFGCFGWLGDVVLAAVKVVFCGFLGGGGFENGEEEDDDDDDEDDEDDDDNEKVD